MSTLNICDLSAGYHHISRTSTTDVQNVINNISFSAEEGSIVGILGENGCGKTTLIKAIANLIPHSGCCKLDNLQLEHMPHKKLAQLCGYIPQKSGISIDISLLDVVMMGFNPELKLLQPPTETMKEKAYKVLAMVGLDSRINDNFQTLSEGQKQLALLARTFVAKRKLLLLDEPESALDFRLRYQIMNLLCSYVERNHAVSLVTLHDSSLALNYCNTLLVLSESKLIGEVYPDKTPIEEMEMLLSKVYGTISIRELRNRQGKRQLVMMKEDDMH